MIRFFRLCLCLVPLAAPIPATAQEGGALDRLRALEQSNVPTVTDLYADEIASDLALIEKNADLMFDPARPGAGPEGAPVAIAMFTSADCADCAASRSELSALADRLGVRVAFLDVSENEEDAALMRQMGLDLLPSYVMRNGMIRGAMPATVLETYLSR